MYIMNVVAILSSGGADMLPRCSLISKYVCEYMHTYIYMYIDMFTYMESMARRRLALTSIPHANHARAHITYSIHVINIFVLEDHACMHTYTYVYACMYTYVYAYMHDTYIHTGDSIPSLQMSWSKGVSFTQIFANLEKYRIHSRVARIRPTCA